MSHTQVDVTCLGTCNIDFISQVPNFAGSEDEINIEKLHINLGGSALNFASRIYSLQIKTGVMANLGKDYFGKLILNGLNQAGIDTSRIDIIKDDTGMAFIAINESGEKSVYSYIGANASFKLDKEDLKFIKNSNLLHVTGMYWEVVEEAAKHSKLLSFNPGPVMSAYGLETLENIINKTQILFLNQKEVSILTGIQWEEGSKLLVDMGVPEVTVTNGAEGARLFSEDETIFAPAEKVHVVDTTGAGDNFAAGFISSYINGESPENCLKNANKTAARCVEKIGGSLIPLPVI
jgi:sugar/nucleoside kinase (ribokinase family)